MKTLRLSQCQNDSIYQFLDNGNTKLDNLRRDGLHLCESGKKFTFR